MSYSSYSRVKASIDEPTHTISQPVIPQAIDLRQLVPQRRQRATAVQQGGGIGSPLAGLSGMTTAAIAAAKGPRKPEQQGGGLRQHAKATLDALTDQAEDQAAQPTGRHAYVIPPSGEAVTATANSRNYPQYPDADGPLGSTGEPAGGFLGNTFGGSVSGF